MCIRDRYKWVEKLNEIIGAQKLNLNLSQIKVDEIKLSELINKLIHSEKNERSNHIRIFLSNQKLNTTFEFHNYLLYLFIPVSYTHLDVYKRQELMRPCNYTAIWL